MEHLFFLLSLHLQVNLTFFRSGSLFAPSSQPLRGSSLFSSGSTAVEPVSGRFNPPQSTGGSSAGGLQRFTDISAGVGKMFSARDTGGSGGSGEKSSGGFEYGEPRLGHREGTKRKKGGGGGGGEMGTGGDAAYMSSSSASESGSPLTTLRRSSSPDSDA